MIVPSIDISDGQAVQLIGGEEVALKAGDPRALMERFSLLGEVAVIDIDAARGEGDNRDLVEELCAMGPVRVGGGIRDVATALDWMDRGANKVILGTAATREILERLPSDRVIVALDTRDDHVLTHGWRTRTERSPLAAMEALRGLCSGFLVTFVEREGRMDGTDLERARRFVGAAGDARVTIAGGIATATEIAILDGMGADAQVGMALYTGALRMSDAVGAILRSDRPDGLWPTVVVDETGHALGLAYSSADSLDEAIETRTGTYLSRSRGLWRKGQTSGATQELIGIDIDCDRDTLRFRVRQTNGFCHTGHRTCWGADRGIERLARRLTAIAETATGGNTSLLLEDRELLGSKLAEEAHELAAARSHDEVVAETADLIYFTLVKAVSAGVEVVEIADELDRREARVRRRPMAAKEG